MDGLPVVAVPNIEVGDVFEDVGEKVDVGVDDGAMDGGAEVGSVGLLEHG